MLLLQPIQNVEPNKIIYHYQYPCPDNLCVPFQSAKLVTTEAEAPASCAPEMRSNQHQVTLLTVQLILPVMVSLKCQMITTRLVVSIS